VTLSASYLIVLVKQLPGDKQLSAREQHQTAAAQR
jgi:hypothetical protein